MKSIILVRRLAVPFLRRLGRCDRGLGGLHLSRAGRGRRAVRDWRHTGVGRLNGDVATDCDGADPHTSIAEAGGSREASTKRPDLKNLPRSRSQPTFVMSATRDMETRSQMQK